MSDCCNTKQNFLLSKSTNFRTFILSYKPDADIIAWMSKFDELLLIPTILSMLVPIVKTGQLDETVFQIMLKLNVPDDEKITVSDKIKRYLTMFVDVATS